MPLPAPGEYISYVGEGKWFLNVEHAASLVHVRFNQKRCINKPAACSTFKNHLPSPYASVDYNYNRKIVIYQLLNNKYPLLCIIHHLSLVCSIYPQFYLSILGVYLSLPTTQYPILYQNSLDIYHTLFNLIGNFFYSYSINAYRSQNIHFSSKKLFKKIR